MQDYYEYQELHKKYIREEGSELIKRDKIITENSLSYEAYINEIRLQWFYQRDYPFIQEGVPLETSSTLSRLYVPSIVREEEYTFVSTKRVSEVIYRDSNPFDNMGLFSDTSYINNRYLASDGNSDFLESFNAELLTSEPQLVWEFIKLDGETRDKWLYLYVVPNKTLLPFVDIPKHCCWDTERLTVDDYYPNELYLLGANSTNWGAWYSLIVEDMTHPFINGFTFTGRVIEQGDESLLAYEYSDTKGWYGLKNELYMSSLKPIELDFPLGIPKEGEVDKLLCNEHLIGAYPSSGCVPYDLGRFTGYTTNRNYHPTKTFYIYERTVDITSNQLIEERLRRPSNCPVFALESIPNIYSLDLANQGYQICNNIPPSLFLETIESKEEIYIEDFSGCSVSINIRDSMCVAYDSPSFGQMYNDCNMIGDSFISHHIKVHYNDINLIDDGFFMVSCAKEDNEILKYMFNDSNYINQTYQIGN
jgi:hypothetical protein